MANLFNTLKRLYSGPRQETRKHPRYTSFIKVYCLVRGSWYRGSIQNVSEGGLYIRSIREGRFSKGDPIVMLVEFGVLHHQIKGRIVRVGSDGIAMEYDTSEPEYSELKALLAHHCLF